MMLILIIFRFYLIKQSYILNYYINYYTCINYLQPIILQHKQRIYIINNQIIRQTKTQTNIATNMFSINHNNNKQSYTYNQDYSQPSLHNKFYHKNKTNINQRHNQSKNITISEKYQPKLKAFILADSDISQTNNQAVENYDTGIGIDISMDVNRDRITKQQYKNKTQIYQNYCQLPKISMKIRYSIESFLKKIQNQQMSTHLQLAIQNLLLNMLSIANNLPELLALTANIDKQRQYNKQSRWKLSQIIQKLKKQHQQKCLKQPIEYIQQQSQTIQNDQQQQQQQQQQLQQDSELSGMQQLPNLINLNSSNPKQSHIKIQDSDELQVLRQYPSAQDQTSSIQDSQQSQLYDATEVYRKQLLSHKNNIENNNKYNTNFNKNTNYILYKNNQNNKQSIPIPVPVPVTNPKNNNPHVNKKINNKKYRTSTQQYQQQSQIQSQIGIQDQPSSASIMIPFNGKSGVGRSMYNSTNSNINNNNSMNNNNNNGNNGNGNRKYSISQFQIRQQPNLNYTYDSVFKNTSNDEFIQNSVSQYYVQDIQDSQHQKQPSQITNKKYPSNNPKNNIQKNNKYNNNINNYMPTNSYLNSNINKKKTQKQNQIYLDNKSNKISRTNVNKIQPLSQSNKNNIEDGYTYSYVLSRKRIF